MKKIFCSFGLGVCLVSSVFANDTLDLLNAEITNTLAPFQNESTNAQLKFDAVELNDERATKVTFNALYNKIGSKNNFGLKLDNFSYDYGNGKSPTTVLKGSIGLDLTRFLTREESNEIIPSAIEFIEDTVKYYTEEFGDAISIKGAITSTSKDTHGNYTGLTALISTKVDLNQLPEDISRDEIPATEVVLSLTLNLKTGVALDALIISNPEYSGFQEDQLGLKEILEHLLDRDTDVIESIFRNLDFIASSIVEMDNSLFWSFIPKKRSLH